MPRHFKVHEELSREELEKLEEFAREPGRTVDECHGWLQAAGFPMSRSAVGTWKRDFDGRVLAERFGRNAELARSLKDAVETSGVVATADAALMQLTQVVFEQSAKLEGDGQLDPLDVMRWTRALKTLTGTKKDVEQLIAAKFDREMKERMDKRGPGGAIDAADLAEARKAIFGS